MSSIRRIASGSAAAWVQLAVAVLSQLAVVPVYLRVWDADTYGAWLTLMGAMTLFQICDSGHTRYLSNEFLRFGAARVRKVRRAFWSACVAGVVLGGLQFCMVVCFAFAVLLGNRYVHFGSDETRGQCALVAVILAGVWWMFGSVGGLAVAVVAPFGHFPKMAWWGVVSLSVTTAVPCLVVWNGGGLLTAGISLAAATVVVNLPLYCWLWRLLSEAGLSPVRPCIALSFRNLMRSQAVTLKNLLDASKQQGLRLILAPLAGTSALAAFSTMRTGANMALQGLSTITNPLMPELMRHLAIRDQPMIEVTLASVWFAVALVLTPFAVMMQLIVEPLFGWWTGGKVEFDPLLFGLFTASVLTYGLAQPAVAIVQGNNLFRVQLPISVVGSAIVLTFTFVLVPLVGVRGAACGLLCAEIVTTWVYVSCARTWLDLAGIHWPRRIFYCTLCSVIVGTNVIVLICLFPAVSGYIAICGFAVLMFLSLRMISILPEIVKVELSRLFKRVFQDL